MPTLWRRLHDHGTAIGDVVDWENGSFSIQVKTPSSSSQRPFRGDVGGALQACDALAQQVHSHDCSSDMCGSWMKMPQTAEPRSRQ